MSDLSPEASKFVDAARESFSPDEQAIVALRTALDARLGLAAASGSTRASAERSAFVSRGLSAGKFTKFVGTAIALVGIGVAAGWFGEHTRLQAPAPLPRALATPHAHTNATVAAAPEQPATPASSLPAPLGTPSLAGSHGRSQQHLRAARTARPAPKLATGRPLPLLAATNAAPHALPAVATTASDDPLVQELLVLRGARAALDRGDPARALELLDQQDVRYPNGVLRQERLATRVLALCALGHEHDAQMTARQLLQIAPRAPYLARMRASCAGEIIK